MARKNNGAFKTPIWKILADSKMGRYRDLLQYAFVEDGKVIATNAEILLIQDLQKCHDIPEEQVKNMEGKLFHRDTIRLLEKCDIVIFAENHIAATMGRVVMNIPYDTQESVGKYVNYKDHIQQNGLSAVPRIGLNSYNLAFVSEAMRFSKNGVILEFTGQNKAIFIKPEDPLNDAEYGIVMPKIIVKRGE